MSSLYDSFSVEVRQARRRLDSRVGEAKALAKAGQETHTRVESLKAQSIALEKAAAVLTSIGEDRQNAAQLQIEALVTRGLQVIFGDDLSFHLIPSIRAKVPVVDFVVRSTYGDHVVETPVMDARGGGLAATVGFLLRLVVLLLSKKQGSVLFLDETFAHVSTEYEHRLAEFLRELVDKTGVQIVLVTHSEGFSDVADKRYKFELVDGVTKVKEI